MGSGVVSLSGKGSFSAVVSSAVREPLVFLPGTGTRHEQHVTGPVWSGWAISGVMTNCGMDYLSCECSQEGGKYKWPTHTVQSVRVCRKEHFSGLD